MRFGLRRFLVGPSPWGKPEDPLVNRSLAVFFRTLVAVVELASGRFRRESVSFREFLRVSDCVLVVHGLPFDGG